MWEAIGAACVLLALILKLFEKPSETPEEKAVRIQKEYDAKASDLIDAIKAGDMARVRDIARALDTDVDGLLRLHESRTGNAVKLPGTNDPT